MPHIKAAQREAARLRCVRRTQLLDTPPEERFDVFTLAASRQFNVPVALVNVVGEDRIWVKSRTGTDLCEVDRSTAFCNTLIDSGEALVVNDLAADPRFHDNPLVTGEPFIRFYAGTLLRVDGHDVGTLCLMDYEPREFSQTQLDDLTRLARIVTRQIELSPAYQAQVRRSA